VHPCKKWQEIVDNTSALYEEAFLCRLGTDKFMVDGRHTGTGGKSRDPRDRKARRQSFIKRPDLLRSLITY
jgi:uncharacterized protein (DUF2126 family)